MRPILPDDLDRCARALMEQPAGRRPDQIVWIVRAADLADRFRKRTGRHHPTYGDGSLGSAAWRAGMVPRPPRCDASYCACLALVLECIVDWRGRTGCQNLSLPLHQNQ